MTTSVGVETRAQVETITPDMAMELLKRNTNNRQLRTRLAASIARDITAGRWQMNGESIILDESGDILDGQHRLYACVIAGEPITALVVRGVNRSAGTTIDTGAKRLASDVLGMAGESNRHQLAAIIRRVLLWDEGYRLNLSGGARITTAHELLDYLAAHPECRIAAEFASNTAKLMDCFPSVVGLMHVLIHRVDTAYAGEQQATFLNGWRTGADLPQGHPVLALRNSLRANVIGGRQRYVEHEQLGLAIIAWNHMRKGRSISRMYGPKGGFTVQNFPEPY